MCNNDNYDNMNDKDISSQNSKKSPLSKKTYLKKISKNGRILKNDYFEEISRIGMNFQFLLLERTGWL